KYDYKLAWMKRLKSRAQALLDAEEPALMAGDYNVIPQALDCWDATHWTDDALHLPATRAAFQELEFLGFTEAFRVRHPHRKDYTFWDYQAGAWNKDHGIRIDHVLMSPECADLMRDCDIDRHVRGREKPSDHVPIWVDLDA
ncbi:MAG: exodeoxyribonuclease III, partial [Pseudomonadota bacterium]